jgi:hypothetical protein
MKISRGPNKWASAEYAPGPSSRLAAAIANERNGARLAASRCSAFADTGNQFAAKYKAAINAAAGVRRPASRRTPARISGRPIGIPFWPARSSPACERAVTPKAARNTSSPTPGRPRGNVPKNKRFRSRLLSFLQESSQGALIRLAKMRLILNPEVVGLPANTMVLRFTLLQSGKPSSRRVSRRESDAAGNAKFDLGSAACAAPKMELGPDLVRPLAHVAKAAMVALI